MHLCALLLSADARRLLGFQPGLCFLSIQAKVEAGTGERETEKEDGNKN